VVAAQEQPSAGPPHRGVSLWAHYGYMTRRRAAALALLATSLTLLISACSPSTNVSTTSTPPRTVTVSATGMADVAPDAARASISVVATDPGSAEAAQADAAVSTTAVIDALTAAGVDSADIATQSVNVGPTYSYSTTGEQTLTGYQASQSITVTLRDLDTAGATLDAVVASAGNTVRIDSLTTFVTDPSVAANAARAQAVDVARAQAEQYAELLGFTLGPVATVSESTSSTGPMPVAMADSVSSAEKVPTPIEAGTTQVSVTVNISWSIEGP
jgi:uncharacterized protein YggE